MRAQRTMDDGERLRLDAFAHDMRTPMCCVQGAAQMALAAGRQGRDVSEQLEQILLAVRAMDRMLSGFTHAAEDCRTAESLLKEISALAGAQASRKGVCLSVDLTALSGVNLRLPDALGRVLMNLTGNAVKYTPPGGMVCVRASLESAYRPWGSVQRAVFVVSDTGTGMKPEFIRRMYAPFARAQETADQPGRGLGLTIVRALVRQLGGSIAVRSAWGRGTVFTVRVPVQEAKRQQRLMMN